MLIDSVLWLPLSSLSSISINRQTAAHAVSHVWCRYATLVLFSSRAFAHATPHVCIQGMQVAVKT